MGAANIGITDNKIICNNINEMNGKLKRQVSIFSVGIGSDYGSYWVNELNYSLFTWLIYLPLQMDLILE